MFTSVRILSIIVRLKEGARFFLRVIAGTARRTLLVAPAGVNTRPTADRAKESLFSIIMNRLDGARFLDIFCGSGAIGIEALSRGVKEATFVESALPALKALKENLVKTKLTSSAYIIEETAEKALGRLAAEARQFDIIFLDPPYDTDLLSQTLAAIFNQNLLAQGGIIIAETDKNHNEAPASFHLYDTREYGRAKFLFYSDNEAI